MKALVTGGAGFIASHIVDRLLSDGYEVAVIDDLSTGLESNINPKVTFFRDNINSLASRTFTAKWNPDLLIHAAAQVSVRNSMSDPTLDVNSNVLGLVNILQGINTAICHLVFISTGGAIYGEQIAFPATEDHQTKPDSIYGLSKLVGELYVNFWAEKLGLSATILRLSNVYGPRQNPHGEAGVVAIFSEALLSGKDVIINGDGLQTRDFINVLDVANAASLSAKLRPKSTLNIGTGIETDINSLYHMLCASLNITKPPKYGPNKAGEQKRSVIDTGLAKKVLDWSAKITLSEGLSNTARWYTKSN